MPRRLFSTRSRTDPTTDQISKPVLVHTDAVPRSDLQSLGRVTPMSAGTGAEAQPTANEWNQLPPSFQDRGYGSGPPSSSGSMASYPDPQTIGVALGSPSVYAQPPRFGTSTPTPRPGTSNSNNAQQTNSPPTNSPPKQKSSRWKKIGGLFKAKQAMERTSPAQPFYQVRINDQDVVQQQSQPFRASPEALSAPPVVQPPWANGYPKGHNYREIYPEAEDENDRRGGKGDGKLNGHSQKSSGSSNQNARGESPWDYLKDEEERGQRTSGGKTEPLLNVDIPDVHMERYSVMFGSLLGGGNRSTLLARRSKHLEKLKTQDEELAPSGEGQGLKPPPRRATSPSPAKSPSFTLFPAAPKATKGQPSQNGPPPRPQQIHPLQKSHTAPIRPSSRSHESRASTSSSQIAFPMPSPRPLTPSNLWAAERNAYLSPILSEAPSTSSGGTMKLQKKSSHSSLREKKEEEKPVNDLRSVKEEQRPATANEAMAQLEESTRQLKMLAKSKDKNDTHRPSTAEGRRPAHPTIATAMSSQTVKLRENPPSRAPPNPPPTTAVPSPPRERAHTAPPTSNRPKTPNSTQFPPRTSSVAASRALTPPRPITASPPPLSSSSAEDLLLSQSDHNDNDDVVQVHVARSISVTKTSTPQRIRQQQLQNQRNQQKQKQQKRQQKKQQEQQHCQQQKQARQMLVPIGARTEPFRGNEKLVEKYHSPQTPTLVENLSSGQSSTSGGSPFRRSQNVLIETA